MSDDRWRRIEELFHAAADLAPAERSAFLARACDGDDELRRQVEALLTQDAAQDNVLQAAIERAAGPTHRTPLSTGTKLGPYQIVAPIGAGGMGEVYRARDPRLGRDVALKILPAAFSSEPDRVRRFEQEGRAAATLNHPNILVIYDVGAQDGLFYAATELLDGETLRERLGGPALPVRKAIDYAIQIARGLAAAHAKGITHRDLKPENLFLTKDGVVKILDLGLAKYSTVKPAGVRPSELSTEAMETDPGMVLGTAGYMSPEQVRGQVADARSDLFSFGCVLYEMISKERAFTGESSVEVMNAILKQEPPELEVALPPSLDRIIRRCLEKQPEDRFQTAVDLAFALESISGTSERKAPELRRTRPWRYILPIALVAGACALAGAWWQWWPRHAPTAGARNLRQLTYDEGTTIYPSLSPDAKLVAYQSDRAGPGRYDIWVQQTSGGSAIRLTKGPGSHGWPTFSADGSTIYYQSTGPPQGIYEISALGGEPRLIAADGILPAVSPDGKYIVYLGPPSYTQVFVAPASGGVPHAVAQDFSASGLRPIWSPDSQRFVFIGFRTGEPETLEWWLVPAAGGTPQQVSWDHWAAQHKFLGSVSAWLPGEAIVASLGRGGGKTQIYRVHSSSAATGLKPLEEPEPLTFGGSSNSDPSFASGKMAFQSGAYHGAIWSLPADTNRGRVTGTIEKLTAEKTIYTDLALTPDGKIMTFSSDRAGGTADLFLRNMESGQERALDTEEPDRAKVSSLINGSGTEVVYTELATTAFMDAYVVPSAGGTRRKICDKCGPTESLSPDGKQFLATRPEYGINLVDIASGKSTLILQHSKYAALQPRFSPDGKWIALQTMRRIASFDVMLAPFRGATRVPEQDWIAVTPAPANVFQTFWSPDGGLLYYVIRVGGSYSLIARHMDRNGHPAGPPFRVFEFTGRLHPGGGDSMTAVPGRFILTMTESSFNIWMMDMPK